MLRSLLNPEFSPPASSAGRLFDGICALLLQRSEVSYEGEGAALTEALSPVEAPGEDTESLYGLSYSRRFYLTEENGLRVFDTRPMITEILSDLKEHRDRGAIALRFMSTMCCMALDQCTALNKKKLPVVLSGGVFQNRFLLTGITSLLEEKGFTVYPHRQVSPNDEGICLGQLAIAQKKRSMNHVFSNANED